ncbi:MAG: hypothetical protein MUE33_04620 [Cytophagaceae bacterium]|jgi:RHS repeat-associated protein|nr:hypothetical protein [Cytophagaceae bacterium]
MLIVLNQKEQIGWFDHQQTQALIYELGADGYIAENALAARYTVNFTDAVLPGASASFTPDERFVYYSKDMLYHSGTSAQRVGKYDTRNGSNTETTGLTIMNNPVPLNFAGDVRMSFGEMTPLTNDALGVTMYDAASPTALVLDENDQGVTKIVPLMSSISSYLTGKGGNLPIQTVRIFQSPKEAKVYSRKIGRKSYEMADHLGNVTVVVSDRKKVTMGAGNTAIATQRAEVKTYTSYYPFGMAQKSRSGSQEEYRYGFNGQERETELSESTTSAEYWMYDARLGRRWNRDPKPNPSLSIYSCFANNPIAYNDVLGDTTKYFGKNGRYLGKIDDNFENQAHFVNNHTYRRQLRLNGYGETQQQRNSASTNLRKMSVAFIGKNSMEDMKKILKSKEVEALFVAKVSETREIRFVEVLVSNQRANRVDASEVNGSYSIEEQAELFGMGHTHPYREDYVNINAPFRWLAEPTPPRYNSDLNRYELNDYYGGLSGLDGKKRQTPLFIGTELGIVIYGSVYPDTQEIVSPNYQESYIESSFFGVSLKVHSWTPGY